MAPLFCDAYILSRVADQSMLGFVIDGAVFDAQVELHFVVKDGVEFAVGNHAPDDFLLVDFHQVLAQIVLPLGFEGAITTLEFLLEVLRSHVILEGNVTLELGVAQLALELQSVAAGVTQYLSLLFQLLPHLGLHGVVGH